MVVLITASFSKFPHIIICIVCPRILPNVKIKLFGPWFSVSAHFILEKWSIFLFLILHNFSHSPGSLVNACTWNGTQHGNKNFENISEVLMTCSIYFAWEQKNLLILGCPFFFGLPWVKFLVHDKFRGPREWNCYSSEPPDSLRKV